MLSSRRSISIQLSMPLAITAMQRLFRNSSIQDYRFWEGAQLAVDSLRKEGVKIEVMVYDTRSTTKNFNDLLTSDEVRNADLLIGHVNVNEAAQLANLAGQLNVPFINANLPNEAGVSNNPNYVMLNSTLFTHCNGIYKFLQRNYSVSNIIVFRKKGATEDRLKSYFRRNRKINIRHTSQNEICDAGRQLHG